MIYYYSSQHKIGCYFWWSYSPKFYFGFVFYLSLIRFLFWLMFPFLFKYWLFFICFRSIFFIYINSNTYLLYCLHLALSFWYLFVYANILRHVQDTLIRKCWLIAVFFVFISYTSLVKPWIYDCSFTFNPQTDELYVGGYGCLFTFDLTSVSHIICVTLFWRTWILNTFSFHNCVTKILHSVHAECASCF